MDYLEFFGNYINIDPIGLVTAFFLILFRIGPIVNQAPFLGAKVAPAMGRMAITIALAVIFLPLITTKQTHRFAFDSAFLGYAMKELLIGFILGFFISIPFHIISSSGIIIDNLRGSGMMMGQDPSLQAQSSSIGIIFNLLLIYLFFQINGPFLFFDIIVKSYEILPADGTLSMQFFNLKAPFWQLSMSLLAKILALSLQLAAPCIVAVLMAEVFLGIANRLAPQVQIAFLGMSLKSLLGLFALWAGWFFLLKQIGKFTLEWITLIDTAFQKVAPYVPK
ncbi:MAG: flagellar biosynthetic protein FliR [Simkaniaceae bacterium]|nr:flagellar biosynthetic protein FliR [Simkaniaceae bacterium]